MLDYTARLCVVVVTLSSRCQSRGSLIGTDDEGVVDEVNAEIQLLLCLIEMMQVCVSVEESKLL